MTRHGPQLAVAILVAAPLTAHAADCTVQIDPAAKSIVFGHMKDFRHDGCVLEGVRAEGGGISVAMQRNESALAAYEIRPVACAKSGSIVGPTFAVSVSQELAANCPAATSRLIDLIRSDALSARSVPGPAPTTKPRPRSSVHLRWLGLLALLVYAPEAVRWARRRITASPHR